MLQEWRLNIDVAEYESNIDANLYKPSGKNKIHRVDSGEHWPTSIKEKIQCFPFLAIMGYNANNMEKNNGLISSLLKVFAMFEISFSYKEEILDVVSLKFIKTYV